MTQFMVPSMTCGGCAAAITRAIKAQDADAQVDIDLSGKQVQVNSRLTDLQLSELIAAAGYVVTQTEQKYV